MDIVKSLAEAVAKDIFELGRERDSQCNRIEFKGGKYPDAEKPQGGMCEVALSREIETSIRNCLGAKQPREN